jgi:hypothetical protein
MTRALTALCSLMLLTAGATQARLTSDVRMVEGKPALFVNGEQRSMILAAPYRPGPRDFNTFRAGGVEIFDFYVRFPWTGPREWDFSAADRKLDEYASLDPEALFLPRILLTPGDWFGEMVPDEITRRDDGTPAGMAPNTAILLKLESTRSAGSGGVGRR